MLLHDAAEVTARRRTRDGYLLATAKTARTGIQIYHGAEMGRADMETVRVYRAPEEVFAKDALASMAHRAVTLDHPSEMVTADNWKKYARGQTGDEVARDGEYVRMPFALMDAEAIRDIDGGKRELSWGYWSDIDWTPGTTPSGEKYDAVQKNIRANHLAVVDAARGGKELRIGDQRDAGQYDDLIALIERDQSMAEPALKTVMVDGISISTTDQGAQAIAKLQQQLKDAEAETEAEKKKRLEEEAKAAASAAAAKKDSDIKDGKIASLTQNIKDAELTPAKLDAAVKARAAVIDAAKKIGGDKIVIDGKTDAEIRRQAVALSLGDDAMKDKNDDFVIGAFELAKVKVDNSTQADPVRDALGSGVLTTDATKLRDAAYSEMLNRQANAWKPAAAAA